jgi:indolepyruvate ferredoxin oxidoreductase
MQKELDRRAGLNTAGFVLGTADRRLVVSTSNLSAPRALLVAADINFSQASTKNSLLRLWEPRAELRGEGKFNGVFSNGTAGPGVDRTGVPSATQISPAHQTRRRHRVDGR